MPLSDTAIKKSLPAVKGGVKGNHCGGVKGSQ